MPSMHVKCDLCDQTFICKSSLLIHLKIHQGEKKYECNYCTKRFVQQGALNRHILIHNDKKPYKCHICFRNFRQSSHMVTHIKTHYKSKDKTCFKCRYCLVQLSEKDQLKTHVCDHTKKRPHKCKVCNKVFSYLGHLKNHEMIHLKGSKSFQYKCIICKSRFLTMCHLKAHLKTHKVHHYYKCSYCDKRYCYENRLQTHMQLHQEKVVISNSSVPDSVFVKKCYIKIQPFPVIYHNDAELITMAEPKDGLLQDSPKTVHDLAKDVILSDNSAVSCDNDAEVSPQKSKNITIMVPNKKKRMVKVAVLEYPDDNEACSDHESSMDIYHNMYGSNAIPKKPYICSGCFNRYSYIKNINKHQKKVHSGTDVFIITEIE
ncbi:putative zinc-finger containing protein [Namao virus]|nr:putative zinc-finger containing protein [Namao virus]